MTITSVLAETEDKMKKSVEATRHELGIDNDALVLLFVGRITREKGVVELVNAFAGIDIPGRRCDLVLVGPSETGRSRLPAAILSALAEHPRIHSIGFTQTMR